MCVLYLSPPATTNDMFDVPDAKRVRRSDLLDDSLRSSFSPPPLPPSTTTPTQEEQHRRQPDFDLDFVDISHETLTPYPVSNGHPPQPSAAPLPALDPKDADPSGSATFEFRLFSTGAPLAHGTVQAHHDETTPAPHVANAGIHRIRIRSPTPLSSVGDGAFVVPYRPQGYYFTNNTTDPARKAAYTDAAVSSGEVLERAKESRWPGTALPWRVIHLDFTKSASSSTRIAAAAAAAPLLPATTKPRRTRAGKKRRLAIRTKYAAMAAQAETEREKRTRRNREKKVKKKEREKTKKKTQAVSKDDVPLSIDQPV